MNIDAGTLDPTTGLVAVPEGYYWEVSNRASDSYPYELVLRKESGSRWKRDERLGHYEAIFRNSAELVDASRKAVYKGNVVEAGLAENLAGKYPPRRA